MRRNLVPPLPRLAGVSTVMRALPPQPPEGHQRRRRGRHESAWRLRVKEVKFAFQSPRSALLFCTPRCINQKQLITITTDNGRGQVDHAIKRLRLRWQTKHHRQSGKSRTSPTGISLTSVSPLAAPRNETNGLATAMTDAVI